MKWFSRFFQIALVFVISEIGVASLHASDSALNHALSAAGANRSQIKKALTEIPANEKAGMKFLIVNMPKHDLRSLTAKFLLNNVSFAYHARTKFPWAQEVPQTFFFNDVLPYANLDEARDPWRAQLFKKFSSLAASCKTRRDAIIAINKKIPKIVNVKYSTKRQRANQSPSESMQSGLASCSGLSILLCDAFRSVGIPARIAGVPMWSDRSGNHTWVEVWDGKWFLTEYYPDKKGLDHSWLLAKAAHADPNSAMQSIYAVSWKQTDTHFPLVWNLKDQNIHAVNRTAFYLKLADKQKKPVAGNAAKVADKGVLVIRAFARKGGERVAKKIIVSENGRVIFHGKTRAARNDLNDVLHVSVPAGKPLTVSFRDARNHAATITVSAKRDRKTAVNLFVNDSQK